MVVVFLLYNISVKANSPSLWVALSIKHMNQELSDFLTQLAINSHYNLSIHSYTINKDKLLSILQDNKDSLTHILITFIKSSKEQVIKLKDILDSDMFELFECERDFLAQEYSPYTTM